MDILEELKSRLKAVIDEYKTIKNKPVETLSSTQETKTASANTLTNTVGKGGKNETADVKKVQNLLNRHGIKVSETGVADTETIAAIEKFQTIKLGVADGIITPGRSTWRALLGEKVPKLSSNETTTPATGTTTPATGTNNSNPQNSSSPVAEFGAGAESTDVYKSQRDNQTVRLRSGREATGGIQCNVTSLAMQLVGLADGDEAKVVALTKELIKKRGGSFQSSWGLEELLIGLINSMGGSIFVNTNLAAAAKLYPFVKKVDTFWAPKKDLMINTVMPALKNGAEVTFSALFTWKGGHIVSMLGVRADGVVLNDPYGCNIIPNVSGTAGYFRNASQGSKQLLSKYRTLLERRLSIRGNAKMIIDCINKGANLPGDVGSKNFYSWSDYSAIQPLWVQIAYKK